MKPHIVGLAGPSSSGKTELSRRIVEKLPGTPIVSLDSYYRDLPGLPLEERAKSNFDCPEALEWQLLHAHLQALSQGLPFDEPTYDFAHHVRTSETRRIEPGRFVIVEGLFVLHWAELRALLDTKIFVKTAPEVCFSRRLARDVAERGRTAESVYRQYEATVRPGAEKYVYPTERHAGLVVSGEQPLEASVATVLKALGVR